MPIGDETQLSQNPCTSANLSDSYEEVSKNDCTLPSKLQAKDEGRIEMELMDEQYDQNETPPERDQFDILEQENTYPCADEVSFTCRTGS